MKRRFLLVPIFLMTACLSGCAPQVTPVETFTHEAGESLPEDILKYATFKKPEKAAEATLDLSKVVADKVGTYEATITLKEKEYTFNFEVVDTTVPEGTFSSYFIAKNSKVVPEDFGIIVKDCSDYKVGFAESELIRKPDEIASLFQESIAIEDGSDSEESVESLEFDFVEMLELAWDETKDSMEQKEYDSSVLASEFDPEEDGLYKVKIVAVDVHGNATLMNAYALIDTIAPVISGAEDSTIVIDNNTNAETMTTIGVSASDNMMGDITSSIIKEEKIVEDLDKDINGFKAEVIYKVADAFGNETIVERNMSFTFDKESIVPPVIETVTIADGFNESMARDLLNLVNAERRKVGLGELRWDSSLEEFAKVRAKEASVYFSHERPDGSSFPYGENLAGNARTTTEVMNGWMNSSGHRSNILHGQCTIFGAACYSSNNKLTWVQIFY